MTVRPTLRAIAATVRHRCPKPNLPPANSSCACITLGEYDGVVTRTAKRRVTEVRLTPADKPEPKKDEEDRQRFNRITNK